MRTAWPLLAGIGALVVGTAFGWAAGLVDALVAPPAIVRAALVTGSLILGLWLLGRAVARIGAVQGGGPEAVGPAGAGPSTPSPVAMPDERDLAGLVRGVRLVFLAVAAFAAAGGWLLGSALPLIVALVIAGVDVVETTFLLLVVGVRRPPSAGR